MMKSARILARMRSRRREFGMSWIELRGMWNKNILDLDARKSPKRKRVLASMNCALRYRHPALQSGLARRAGIQIQPEERQVSRRFGFTQQDDVLRHSIELAKQFQTDRVRCFDFWPPGRQAPYRKAINEKLRDAAAVAAKSGIKLVLENEMTATQRPQPRRPRCSRRSPIQIYCSTGIPETQPPLEKLRFPTATACCRKAASATAIARIVTRKPDGSTGMGGDGQGIIDWVGQFRALREDGYRLAASLETHWHGAGTPEESSRQAGLECKRNCTRRRFVNDDYANLKSGSVPG